MSVPAIRLMEAVGIYPAHPHYAHRFDAVDLPIQVAGGALASAAAYALACYAELRRQSGRIPQRGYQFGDRAGRCCGSRSGR